MDKLEENPDIVWKRKISKNGKEYRVGYLKDEEKFDTNEKLDADSFDADVDWPVSDKDKWKVQKSSFLNKTAISRYKLENRTFIYSYQLNITCQEHYDYYFTDASGDIYNIDAFANGNHYVNYNSDEPTIKHIKGTL